MPADLVIYGAGGMGQEAADIIRAATQDRNGRGCDQIGRLVGFVDDDQRLHSAKVMGLEVLGSRSWLAGRDVEVVVAVGSPAARRRTCDELRGEGVRFASPLVHPRACIGEGCRLGTGAIVAANATLTVDVEIGNFGIVNVNASVSHNCRLGDFVTVAPGANLAGNVTVDEGADVGIGASVIQGRHIGAWSVIGAGAVVIADVDPDTTVVGVPARVVSKRQPGWQQ